MAVVVVPSVMASFELHEEVPLVIIRRDYEILGEEKKVLWFGLKKIYG